MDFTSIDNFNSLIGGNELAPSDTFAIGGVPIRVQRRTGSMNFEFKDTIGMSEESPRHVAWSPDGTILAVGFIGGNVSLPTVMFYLYRDSGFGGDAYSFAALTIPALPLKVSGDATKVYPFHISLSPDSKHVIIFYTSDTVAESCVILRRTNDTTFVRLTVPPYDFHHMAYTDAYMDPPIHTAWSIDGKRCYVTNNKRQELNMFLVDDDGTVTAKNDVGIRGGGGLGSISASPDGQFFAVSIHKSDHVHLYRDDGSDLIFVNLAMVLGADNQLVVFTNGSRTMVRWSPCGQYLALVLPMKPWLVFFKIDADELRLLPYPSDQYIYTGLDCGWSPDGRLFLVRAINEDQLHIYEFDGMQATKLAQIPHLSEFNGRGYMSWHPSGKILTNTHEYLSVLVNYRAGVVGNKPGPLVGIETPSAKFY